MPNNPPIDYTSKDYDGFRQLLIDAIPARIPEWTSRSPSDFGIVLIEMFSYVGDVLSYYGDRIVNEAFLSTATQRRSVLDLAEMLDYTPGGNSAAGTTLQFTVNSGVGNITIPAGTRVSTSSLTAAQAGTDPVYFETDAALTIDSGATTTGTVAGTEGRTVSNEAVATSDGTVSQEYPLFFFPVIDGSVVVKVDEGTGAKTWRRFTHLIDASSTDAAYSLRTDENDVVFIRFGDDVNGRIPASGAAITATYRRGGGERGNVSASTVVELVDTIANVTAVTNTTTATGGGDKETLAEIKENAPRSLRTLNRAVTTADYANLALAVAGVARAAAEADVSTSVNLYIAPIGGGAATQALKDKVLDALATKKMIGTTVTPLDPSYIDVNVTATVTVSDEYDRGLVETEVTAALNSLLAFKNVDFAKRISLAQVYRTILNIDGVDYGSVDKLVRDDDGDQNQTIDIVTTASEIPQMGTLSVTASGGILGT